MANEVSSAGIRLEEAASGIANGTNESTSKTATEEVEDKVDDLTLDEPQDAAKKKKKKSKSKKKKEPLQQTDPPSIPVAELFASGEFPEGEIQQYKDEMGELKSEKHIKYILSVEKNMMGPIKAAIADGLLTFMWIFCASSLGPATYVVASSLGLAQGLATLFITTFLIFLLLFIFGFIGDLLGGASFNPTATAAFYAVGLGGADSLVSAALRFPAQAAGAVGGVLAIVEVMPVQYKHMLGGPSLKVDLHTGAIAEGVLTFVITFNVLLIIIKGPSSIIIKNWLLAMSTVALVVAGSSYTGPSMNPVNAFGWAYITNTHNTWEQFYVYWICPFVGAIVAAWTFRFLFPLPTKQKA